MPYKVQLLSSRLSPISVEGRGRFCLGHLARLLHLSAVQGPGGDFSELLSLASSNFEQIDSLPLPAGDLPPFNESSHFRFRGSASWRAANLEGILEFLANDGVWVQAGFQVKCLPVLLFGSTSAYKNALNDILSAALESYPKVTPASVDSPISGMVHFTDDLTLSYFSVDEDQYLLTYRIGNRPIWKHS